MRPVALVVRSTGCGRFVGLVFVAIGALVLLSYYHIIPGRVSRWWPVLIIGLGALLFLRHYWRIFRQRSPAAQVLDPNAPIPSVPVRRTRKLSPPAFPLIIAGVGAYLLLRNLHYISLGVVLAVTLILIGLLFLASGMRTGRTRKSMSERPAR